MMCFAVLLQIDLVLYCYMHFRVILLLILLLYYSPSNVANNILDGPIPDKFSSYTNLNSL